MAKKHLRDLCVRRHKYEALEDYLAGKSVSVCDITVSFRQIENIIGNKLPKSAYTYTAWWANQTDKKNRPQAKAWLDANFVVDGFHLDKKNGWVRFMRRKK